MRARNLLARPLSASLVAGCVGASPGVGMAMGAIGAMAGGAGGVNPLSFGIHQATTAAATANGMAKSAVISPQEKAKYAAMSCPELRQMIANYEVGLTASPASKKYGAGGAPAGKMAIVKQVITTRLAYLKQLSASKGC